jgi:hypothetical protein
MASLEIKDFWDFYFYRETKAVKEVALEKREAEGKPKKKRWLFR